MAALDSAMEDKDVTTVMRRALKMQIDLENDWRTFKADILASFTLHIFGYMTADSPFVKRCIHAPGMPDLAGVRI